ncbi:MAG: hypothetical protein IJ005_03825 [Bacteroidales bacterium]|nr:hypothetical protein [Bacteroidales bacterium]
MKKMFLIAISLLCGIIAMSAQDLEGVEIYTVMTPEEIVAKFGEPTEYKFYYNDDNKKVETYYFGKNGLRFTDGEFDEFYIYDDTFSILKNYIKGGVKVGDHISVFDGFEDIHLRRICKNGDKQYSVFRKNDAAIFNLYTKDDIILRFNLILRP